MNLTMTEILFSSLARVSTFLFDIVSLGCPHDTIGCTVLILYDQRGS